MNYRLASPDDAPEMVSVHYASVQNIQDGRYSNELLHAWSPPPCEARTSWLAGLIGQQSIMSFVAESPEGRIVGFCILLLDLGELKALYVHPEWSRQGIGSQLLQAVERECRVYGIEQLKLNASYNAESFYSGVGFESLGPARQALSESLSMGAIHMAKVITFVP